MSAQPDVAGFVPAQLGPDSDDATLATWCDAATAGTLPAPTLARWQVLRSGVVNLWEFDVAEYWFAGGRAQFVGQNQCGKSTLMALTTLIMLAGDLDRKLVDTFGQQHKSFRYYVEPTTDDKDRRDTGDSTSRGWAWVEYGRLVQGAPEFFTALLYTQARRGANDYTKTWATCAGTARVGAGLTLHRGASTAAPADLADVPGYAAAGSGTEYKHRLATALFGFEDADRLAAVVRMLKVLRTPHLGQRLDPAFVTAQMREALPSIARAEIDGLADGWDELERLAADRDSADSARAAVAAYVRKAWAPWADAVLRLQADNLLGAGTQLDNVTRRTRDAEGALTRAEETRDKLSGALDTAEANHGRVTRAYENLLKSQAFRDAQGATELVKNLKVKAEHEDGFASTAEAFADAAQSRATERGSELDSADKDGARAEATTATQVLSTQGAARSAGLPDASDAWVAEGDDARLSAAVTARRDHVTTARALLSALDKATGLEDGAARAVLTAQQEHAARAAQAKQATAALGSTLQAVSDDLETWALTVGPGGPAASLRQHWVAQTAAASAAADPRPVLGALVRTTWLDPAVAPLREAATLAESAAGAHQGRADDLNRQADLARAQVDPVPAPPTGWTRRARAGGDPTHGAPLWRLLDPAGPLLDSDGTPLPGGLDPIEAALAAAGLLDAWVTPDGVYLPGRDGNDTIVTTAPGRDQGGPGAGTVGAPLTLAAVLAPAADVGECAGSVAEFLDSIGWEPPAGPAAPAGTGSWVAHDGRWSTPLTAGQAAAAPDGAELIGTSARQGARARTLARLAADAADAADAATAEMVRAADLRAQASTLMQAATHAPGDHHVVRTALAVAAADHELDRAEQRHDAADRDLQGAQGATAAAGAELLTFAGTHDLSPDEAGLSRTSEALNKAAAAIHQLVAALAALAAAKAGQVRARRLADQAQEEHRIAVAAAEKLRTSADHAQEEAESAEASLGQGEKALLAQGEQLDARRAALADRVKGLQEGARDQAVAVAKAELALAGIGIERERAETLRDDALRAWWVPVDAGLGLARGLPEAAGRLLTHAVHQARAAREMLHPERWPDMGAPAEKNARVQAAWTRLAGPAMTELRTVLESSGGRSASVLDAPEDGSGLPAVAVVVDSSGASWAPTEAVGRLEEQAQTLARLHDAKMQEVLVELLASTFVEHLRDRLKSVVSLLARVNAVLASHPTGASQTTLRLVREPAAGQQAAFEVLTALESKLVDDESVQGEVRRFLEQQIREAQELGRASAGEWKEHLSDLLDYRLWFDVRTDYRVGQARWAPLTREVHDQDSGGGKVITLLQPLLATLVALYDESEGAPRPLWLDEAFTGIDDDNRATMLALLVEFDLDFLLAGPATLVSAAQVPSAAVWFVTRAPAPTPGVDLSLMLWAGRTLTAVRLPAAGLSGGAETSRDLEGPDLFTADAAEGASR